MAEEWVKNARNQIKAEAYSYAEAEKSLRALKQEQTKLANKLTISEKACLSAKTFLNNAEAQAKDQRK